MLVKYSDDKPSDCKYCYFWMPGKKKCKFDECYYIVRKVKKKRVQSQCYGCPYGRTRPCIGWCTRLILGQIKKKEYQVT